MRILLRLSTLIMLLWVDGNSASVWRFRLFSGTLSGVWIRISGIQLITLIHISTRLSTPVLTAPCVGIFQRLRAALHR